MSLTEIDGSEFTKSDGSFSVVHLLNRLGFASYVLDICKDSLGDAMSLLYRAPLKKLIENYQSKFNKRREDK